VGERERSGGGGGRGFERKERALAVFGF